MDELHRMLGSTREADFEQEAARRRLAKEARPAASVDKPVAPKSTPKAKARPWLLALVMRELRSRA